MTNKEKIILGDNGTKDKTLQYMKNIENIFGKYLNEDDNEGFDGQLEGSKTSFDRYSTSDEFSKLNKRFSHEKIKLTKQKLVNTLLHEMLDLKNPEFKKHYQKVEGREKVNFIKDLNVAHKDYENDLNTYLDDHSDVFINKVEVTEIEVSYTKQQVEIAETTTLLAIELQVLKKDTAIEKIIEEINKIKNNSEYSKEEKENKISEIIKESKKYSLLEVNKYEKRTYFRKRLSEINNKKSYSKEVKEEKIKELISHNSSILHEYSKPEKKAELQKELLFSHQEENKAALDEILKLKIINKKNPGKISQSELDIAQKKYEDVVLKNTNIAIDHDLAEESNELFSKTLERGMTSGLLPIGLMLSSRLKKGLPMLPAVIGAGIYTRVWHIVTSDNPNIDAWTKSGEVTKVIGYTIAAIAPFSGTGIAVNDAMNAKETGDKVACRVGVGISGTFDFFTVLAAMSGAGAPAAVGLQAVKVSAKESGKILIKKAFNFITLKGTEHTVRQTDTLLKTTKEFFKQNTNTITSGFKEMGFKKFTGKIIQTSTKETGEGMWGVMSAKAIRETDIGKKILLNKPFELADNATIGLRVNLLKKLEKTGLVPKGAHQRIGNAHLESRALLAEIRPDSDVIIKNEMEVKALEMEETTLSLDNLLTKTAELVNEGGNPELLKHMIKSLKQKDYHMANAMNILNGVSSILKTTNVKETKVKKLKSLLKEYDSKMGDNLKSFINDFAIKNAGEDFSESSAYQYVLLNKTHGKSIRENDIFIKKGLSKEYEDIMKKNNINESELGYITNYFKIEANYNEILKNPDIKGEKKDIIIKGYLDHIRQGDIMGWGKIKMEAFAVKEDGTPNYDLIQKSKDGKIRSSYEHQIDSMLNNTKLSKYHDNILKDLDLTLIKDEKLLKQIFSKAIVYIEKNPSEISEIVKKLKNTGKLEKELNGFLISSTVSKIIKKQLTKEGIDTNNFLFLSKFTSKEITELIIKKTESKFTPEYIKNTLLKENGTIKTKELNRLLSKLTHLPISIKKDIYMEIAKSTCKQLGPVNDKFLLDNLLSSIVSFKYKADVIKTFPDKIINKDTYIKTIIESNNDFSIEYTLKFIKEFDSHFKGGQFNTADNKNIFDLILKRIDNNEIQPHEVNLINYFLERSEIKSAYKDNPIYKSIQDKNKLMKKSDLIYAKIKKETSSIISNLKDQDRVYSKSDLLRYKQAGKLNHNTLAELNKEKTALGKIRKKEGVYTEYEKKIDLTISDVKEALDTYKMNLFNREKYDHSDNKIDYLNKEVILLNGSTSKKENLYIFDQLSHLKNTEGLSTKDINDFLYNYLGKVKENTSIKSKIELLNSLERAGIINPSSEIKLEFMVKIGGDINDMRKNILYIKEYIKDFDINFVNDFEIFRNKNPDQRKQIILDTIDQRMPEDLSYMEKHGLLEQTDKYVKLKNKDGIDEYYIIDIKPNRYFMNKFLESTDLKYRESMMELLKDKSDFGGMSAKEYYDSLPDSDIQGKLLLSLHDDLKLREENIELIKKYSKDPKYMEVVLYIKVKNQYGEYDGKTLTKDIIEKEFTKEYFETKEGKKLTDQEYLQKKNVLLEIVELGSNNYVKALITSIRDGNEVAEETGKLSGKIIEYIKQNPDSILALLKIDSSIAKNIKGLNEDITIQAIIAGVREDLNDNEIKIVNFLKHIDTNKNINISDISKIINKKEFVNKGMDEITKNLLRNITNFRGLLNDETNPFTKLIIEQLKTGEIKPSVLNKLGLKKEVDLLVQKMNDSYELDIQRIKEASNNRSIIDTTGKLFIVGAIINVLSQTDLEASTNDEIKDVLNLLKNDKEVRDILVNDSIFKNLIDNNPVLNKLLLGLGIISSTARASSFQDNFKSKDYKLIQDQYSILSNKISNLSENIKTDRVKLEQEISKLLPEYSELKTVKERKLLDKKLFEQVNFTPQQNIDRIEMQNKLDFLNNNKLLTLVLGTSAMTKIINEFQEEGEKLGELNAKALKVKLDDLKSEIYEVAKKHVKDEAKAALVTEQIFDYLKDFKSEKNEVKYLGRIDGLSVENQKNLLNRYGATVSIINPTNIQEDKLPKELQKSLNNNVKYIYNFYNAIDSGRSVAEETAIKHESKVPELKGTQIMQIEKQEGQIADIKAKINLERERLVGKGLDKTEKEWDEINKNRDEINKNRDERLIFRNSLLGDLKSK